MIYLTIIGIAFLIAELIVFLTPIRKQKRKYKA